MEHIGSRIKAFREKMGLTQSDLFRTTGIKQTTLSSIESGTEPKAGIVGAMLAAYPTLNPDWLLTGAGEMLRGAALTKKEPMLPGGTQDEYGSTIRQPGTRPHIEFEESSDYQKPEKPAPKVPANDQEFIEMLVKRIRTLEATIVSKDVLETKLHNIIEQQQKTIQFTQDQVERLQLQLQGKFEGNQLEAPGTSTDTQPRGRVGFEWYGGHTTEKDAESECVVRQMLPYPSEEESTAAAA